MLFNQIYLTYIKTKKVSATSLNNGKISCHVQMNYMTR